MKKKVVSLLLVGVLAMSTFVGCGSKGSSDAKSEDGSSDDSSAAAMYTSDDENTLTIAAWDASFNIPAIEAAAEAYKEKNPDAKIEIIEQSQSKDIENAVTTAAEAGDYSNLPDIVLFQDHYIQQYQANYPDAWQDVDDADIDWSDFGEEKLSFSTIGGKHYGVPVDNGTVVFAYRVDLLEECGYTMDDVTGITWDKFIEIGEQVYNKTGKYLLSMDGSGNDLPYMMLQAEGVSQFKDGKANLVGNDKLEKILDVIERMQEKNVLLLENDWDGYTNDIQKDKVAGVMNGNWIIPTIEKVEENSGKWEITSMPTLGGEEGYASNGGSSLYITANCKKTDLAKDLETPITLADYLPSGITLAEDTQEVMVKVAIEKVEEKTLVINADEINIVGKSDDLNYDFTQNISYTLKVKGLSQDLENLKVTNLIPSIDVTGYGAGTYKFTVSFKELKGIEILDSIETELEITQIQ